MNSIIRSKVKRLLFYNVVAKYSLSLYLFSNIYIASLVNESTLLAVTKMLITVKFAEIILSSISAKILDRISFYYGFIIGGTLLTMGHILLLSKNSTILYIAVLLLGVSHSVIFNSSTIALKHSDSDSSILAFRHWINNLGCFVGSVVISVMQPYFSWRSIFLFNGLVVIISYVIVFLVVRRDTKSLSLSVSEYTKFIEFPNIRLNFLFNDRLLIFILSTLCMFTYNIILSLESSFIIPLLETVVNKKIYGFNIPTAIFTLLNPIVVVCCSRLFSDFLSKRTGKNHSVIYPLSIGIFFIFITFVLLSVSIFYPVYTTSLCIFLYYLFSSLAEVLITPTSEYMLFSSYATNNIGFLSSLHSMSLMILVNNFILFFVDRALFRLFSVIIICFVMAITASILLLFRNRIGTALSKLDSVDKN